MTCKVYSLEEYNQTLPKAQMKELKAFLLKVIYLLVKVLGSVKVESSGAVANLN